MGCGILFPSNLEETRQAALDENAAAAAVAISPGEGGRECGRGSDESPISRYKEMHNGSVCDFVLKFDYSLFRASVVNSPSCTVCLSS